MDTRKKKNLLIGGLLAIVLIMAVGYAAFATNLNINSTAETTSTWDIEIISISANSNATCSDNTNPSTCTTKGDISHSITNNNLTANFNAALIAPGDSVVYTIQVQNKGTLDATLSTLTQTDSNNPAITFTVSGIQEGDTLAAGATTTFTATVSYPSSVQSQPASTSSTFSLTLNYTQYAAPATPSLVIDDTFVPTYYEYHIGSTVKIGSSYDTSAWTTNPASLERDYYLGHDVDGSGNVTANYACFILNNTQYCMRGKDGSSGTNYWTQNKALLGTLKEQPISAITCSTFSGSSAECSGGGLGFLIARSSGYAYAGVSSSVSCIAYNYGDSECIG